MRNRESQRSHCVPGIKNSEQKRIIDGLQLQSLYKKRFIQLCLKARQEREKGTIMNTHKQFRGIYPLFCRSFRRIFIRSIVLCMSAIVGYSCISYGADVTYDVDEKEPKKRFLFVPYPQHSDKL